MDFKPSNHRGIRSMRRSIGRRQAQRGVTLLFALITLVALLFATLALVRSVDTSTILMGNLGFKQDATATADQATKQAVDWLTSKKAVLMTDSTTDGYYASTQEMASDGTTAQPPIDATGQQLASVANRALIDWDGNKCSSAAVGSYKTCAIKTASATAINGNPNSARYVIFRLCTVSGDYTAPGYLGICAKPLTNTAANASKKGELNYSDSERFTGSSSPYYRVVVRVQGARNTTSFTETIVHF